MSLLAVITAAFLSVASAAEAESDIWSELEHLPPKSSWDLGVQVSYGEIVRWQTEVPPWVGFGVRFGWGKHVGSTRFGLLTLFSAEGPIPLHYTLGLEPSFAVDHVGGRLQLGASIGAGGMYHAALGYLESDTLFSIVPMVSARIGFSQPFSIVGRRFFVLLEPKLRWSEGALSPGVALVIGSGRGK